MTTARPRPAGTGSRILPGCWPCCRCRYAGGGRPVPAGPADRIGRETGRHTGDPPLNVLFGKFLN